MPSLTTDSQGLPSPRGGMASPSGRSRNPDAFDRDGFDAIAYINEMFPTGEPCVVRNGPGCTGPVRLRSLLTPV